MAESEYAGDLKSPGRNTVWVQVPPFAPFPDVVKYKILSFQKGENYITLGKPGVDSIIK